MTELTPDKSIDITKEICPMTILKTKLKLETMEAGQVLEVTLREGEPLANLPKSVEQEGHKVLDIHREDSFYKILIQRS